MYAILTSIAKCTITKHLHRLSDWENKSLCADFIQKHSSILCKKAKLAKDNLMDPVTEPSSVDLLEGQTPPGSSLPDLRLPHSPPPTPTRKSQRLSRQKRRMSQAGSPQDKSTEVYEQPGKRRKMHRSQDVSWDTEGQSDDSGEGQDSSDGDFHGEDSEDEEEIEEGNFELQKICNHVRLFF
jgi:hypothetical protein